MRNLLSGSLIALALAITAGCGVIDAAGPALPGAKGDGHAPISEAKVAQAIGLWERAETGSFSGTGGVQLHYKVFRAPAAEEIGGLVIINGRSESHAKYAELLHDLQGYGLSLYVYDHRGQGLSQRLLDDPRKGHVGSYSDYVEDLATFVAQVVRPRHPAGRPLYALGHSMGGAVLTLYLLQQDQTTFDAVVLSSPMYKLVFPDMREEYVPSWAVPDAWTDEDIAYYVAKLRFDDSYAKDEEPESFETNDLTRSRERYEMFGQLYGRLEAAGVVPLGAPPDAQASIQLGPPTNGWVEQSVLADRAIRGRAAALTTPMLVMQAGADQVVVPSAEAAVCQAAARCQLLPFPEARHEIMMELDQVRSTAIEQMVTFFRSTRR